MAEELLEKLVPFFEGLDMQCPNFDKFLENLSTNSISPLNVLSNIMDVYVRNNYLGPVLGLNEDILKYDKTALDLLSVNGETPFALASGVFLLWLCKELSTHLMSKSSILNFKYAVIRLKCLYLIQHLYGLTRCPSIKDEFDEVLDEVNLEKQADMFDSETLAFCLLSSYMAAFYYDFDKATEFKEVCESALGIQVRFDARLGTKTKAQENALSQLVVCVERKDASVKVDLPNIQTASPEICALEDENLLDFINFKDGVESAFQNLSIPEQALILLCGDVHRSMNPHDELINEQSLAYITAIIRSISEAANKQKDSASGDVEKCGTAWPLLSEALFKRGFYERLGLARAERAIRQMEQLSRQFTLPTPALEERGMQYFFWSRMPSFWQLELSYASLLTKIGSTKSALDIYLRWQQWNEVIISYAALGKRDLAEKKIRERIAEGYETPELYCCLGDVTEDTSYYEKAWELSQHRSARAMRSLGYHASKKLKDQKKAAQYFKESLEINRFQVSLWFTLGCCYMDLKDFMNAERAFRYSVTLEPDNFEAWNNLASAVIFNGRKDQALKLLKEACKWNYQSWRIWENVLVLSMDQHAFSDALHAYNRLVELRKKHTDPQILGLLVRAVAEDMPDITGRGAARFKDELLVLFGRVTAANPADADTWRQYANLLLLGNKELTPNDYQKAVQYIQRSCQCRIRCLPNDWGYNKEVRDDLLADLQALVKLLIVSPTNHSCGSAGEGSDQQQQQQPEELDEEMRAFITNTLSTLRLSINVVQARLKTVINNCMPGPAMDELTTFKNILGDLHTKVKEALHD